MCLYGLPVIHWLYCGHKRTMDAVRLHNTCIYQRQAAYMLYRVPLVTTKCLWPQYCNYPIYTQGLCPSCTRVYYYRSQEAAAARYGPQVGDYVPRPAFLIPSYSSYPIWPPGQPQSSPLGVPIGLSPAPMENPSDEERKRNVLDWVAKQARYRYETVQESSLRALDGASLGCPPSGRMEGVRSVLRLRAPNPVPAIRRTEANNAEDTGGN